MKQVTLTQVQKALLYIQALGHSEADIVMTSDDFSYDSAPTVCMQSKQVLIDGDPPVYQSIYIRLHQVDVEAFAAAYDRNIEHILIK